MDSTITITNLIAREILDSRGNPTVELQLAVLLTPHNNNKKIQFFKKY